MNGKFEYLNGRIIITNMLVVKEDVTSVTGKLEVDGSVYVIGSIYSGGCIKATGDIIIEHNVEMGRLIAGGNVMIKKEAVPGTTASSRPAEKSPAVFLKPPTSMPEAM